jgi:diguanylate cyclase (GGDEF)-like protein
MREILESCVRIDESAQAAYLDVQARCTDDAVATLCGYLAADKGTQAQWWRDLVEEWAAGRVPRTWAGEEEVAVDLTAATDELAAIAGTASGPLDAQAALMAAARIEYPTLDPVFAELIELSEPGLARTRHEAYSHHIDALASAFERTFEPESTEWLMATVLRRTHRNNLSLSRYSTRDALTGLGNRRALAAQAGQWASWSARYGGAMSFVLVDVDEFRIVNDVWGHHVGDRVLVELAKAIRSTVRSADLVTRLGNDEFIVLAPELEPEGARVLADRLLSNIRALRVAAEGDAYLTLTASAGIVTVFDPPNSEPRGLDEMLAAADLSLSSAKRAGRDCAAEPTILARGAETASA